MVKYYPILGVVAIAVLVSISACTPRTASELPFVDNFSDAASGWGADETEAFSRGYVEGEYSIEVHSPNQFLWADPGQVFDDVAVEVDLYPAPGSENGYAGVLCRHEDLQNFYYFAVGSEGYYAIFRRVDGSELEILSGGGSAVRSEAIRQGEQVNHILAVCQGNTLSLYANGELLETVEDSTHRLGDVGVGAASRAPGDVRFHFDNFQATEP